MFCFVNCFREKDSLEQAKEEVGKTQHAFLFVIWPHDL